MTVNLDLGHRASADSVGVRACIRIIDSREANDSDLLVPLYLFYFSLSHSFYLYLSLR